MCYFEQAITSKFPSVHTSGCLEENNHLNHLNLRKFLFLLVYFDEYPVQFYNL